MMTEIRCVLTVIFMVVGLFFMAVSVAGVIRFPDFFSRLHAIGLGQSLGMGFCCIGLLIYQGPDTTGIKIFMVLARNQSNILLKNITEKQNSKLKIIFFQCL